MWLIAPWSRGLKRGALNTFYGIQGASIPGGEGFSSASVWDWCQACIVSSLYSY
jgi:hypothetical protein